MNLKLWVFNVMKINIFPVIRSLLPALLLLAAAGCGDSENRETPTVEHLETPREAVSSAVTGETYTVTRLSDPVRIDSEWNKEPWNGIPAIHINNHMGDEPDPRPIVHAKLAYDEEAIYVIFRAEDQFVRCVVDDYQGPVSQDSCVEFFFTPGTDISKGYFNLEINCAGTSLFAFQRERGVDRVHIPKSDFRRVDVSHSMPGLVEEEIEEPVTWTIEVRIPFDILPEYTDVIRPAPGVEWRANLYKIASGTSHPHYLTWSPVDHPVPQFHLPEYFGALRFD